MTPKRVLIVDDSPTIRALIRTKLAADPRIVVVGDGDFLSNSFLGNGGNLELGVNMIQWLSRGDALINIPARVAPDRKLQLSPVASGAIAIGFLFLLPAVLIGIGAWVWFKRRSR